MNVCHTDHTFCCTDFNYIGTAYRLQIPAAEYHADDVAGGILTDPDGFLHHWHNRTELAGNSPGQYRPERSDPVHLFPQ